jgi:esterase/lipase superfamily enzyme
MPQSFVMSAREVKGGKFEAEPGRSRYLLVPDGKVPTPDHEVSAAGWFRKLRAASVWGTDARRGGERGDILVFVHGYNNLPEVVIRRHRRIEADLREAGWKGAVMSFDWPSDDKALLYLEDRHDAKAVAMRLVTDGIAELAREQTPGCTINIHLLGHSTGAYVIREAFDDADDAHLASNSWMVSQVAFVAGDISSGSLEEGDSSSNSLFRHCLRLTNYSNGRDSVLKLSNAKRIGLAPRVGRVGLPEDAPAKAVNVDCTAYFEKLSREAAVRARDQSEEIGAFDHSWHIGNRRFARDFFEVLKGDLDRAEIPGRKVNEEGGLELD